MGAGDSWNKKLYPHIKGVTHLWMPSAPEVSLLWISFIGQSHWLKGYWIKHRATNYLDVQWVELGSMTVQSGECKYTVPAGSLLVIPPGASCRLSTNHSDGCKKKHMGFFGNILHQNLSVLGVDRIIVVPDVDITEFAAFFDPLFLMAAKKIPSSVHDFASEAYRALLWVSQKMEQPEYPPELTAAKSLIDWNFSGAITLDELCIHSGCGKTTLQWQFARHLGKSPVQYLIETRMKNAERMLRYFSMPIKSIAEACGYANQLYFSNVFRKHFGTSPKTYRKEYAAIPGDAS